MSDHFMSVQAKTDVQAGDDDFEAYRKRMMLGYKHRWVVFPGANTCMHGIVLSVLLINAGAMQTSPPTACCGSFVSQPKCTAEPCCCCAGQIPLEIPESSMTPEDSGYHTYIWTCMTVSCKEDSVETSSLEPQTCSVHMLVYRNFSSHVPL